MFFQRYDKHTTEEFAIKTIAQYIDPNYRDYISPRNMDNFDFISPDNTAALEVTSVIPQNEMNAYVFEKEQSFGKANLSTKKIRGVKFKEDGSIFSYYGGTMTEIKNKVIEKVYKKHKIALNRMNNSTVETVDLCVLVNDGGLFDRLSFEIAFSNFDNLIFDNIYFITCLYVIKYCKKIGFINCGIRI